MQCRRKLFPGQSRVQIKPGKPGRCRSMPGETHLLLRKPDEPAVGGGLDENHGHRSLVELKEAAAIRIARQNEVAAEFRQALFRPPERLALLNVPAGTGGCEQILGRRLATAKKREHGQQG